MKKRIFGLVIGFSLVLSNLALAAGFDKNKDDVIYGVALNDQQRKIVDNAVAVSYTHLTLPTSDLV